MNNTNSKNRYTRAGVSLTTSFLSFVITVFVTIGQGISQSNLLSSDVAYATTIPVPGSSTSCISLFGGRGIQGVNVEVKNLDTGDMETDVTDFYGDYQVNIPFGRLAITPTKLCATWQCWVNGVTTLDLVFILKHLNNLDTIGCPFRRIAADANNDGIISQPDIDLIQTLILRSIESLPNVPSWRFVSNEYFLFSGAGFQNFDPAFPFVFWDMLGNLNNPMPANYHYLSDTYTFNGNPSWVDVTIRQTTRPHFLAGSSSEAAERPAD